MRPMTALGRKLRGLVMLAVIVGLLSLTVLIYQKALPWQSTVPVTLDAARAGHQLDLGADVKYHGVFVGSVRSISTHGDLARIGLAIDPSYADDIPRDVKARILPKTLFGEKFVDLVAPPGASATPSAHVVADTVIPEDRSSTAIELEKVFDDVIPLLRTLQPAQLNLTLSALADTLRGRGEELGVNLSRVDTYFADFNPHLPTLDADISGLADLASNLESAAPDLLTTLHNFADNAQTLTEKKDTFVSFLQQTQGFATTATQVLTENETDLVKLANVSRPTLDLLARYSPEFPCLLQGLDAIEPLLGQTFKPHGPGRRSSLHIEVELIPQPAGYTYPSDKPDYSGYDTGPNCRGLPDTPQNTAAGSGSATSSAKVSTSGYSIGSSGDPADKRTLSTILAPLVGVDAGDVSDTSTTVAGAFMHGMAVSLS